MECINHAGQMASGTCQSCGKALCTKCANRFSPPLCEGCLLKNNNNVTTKLISDVAITVIVCIILIMLLVMKGGVPINESIPLGLFLVGGWWGWQALSDDTTPHIIILPTQGASVFYLFKLSLAMTIGIFVMPVVMLLRIIKIYQINKLKREVLAGKA